MHATVLRMEQAEYDEIRRHGEKTYPDECCGVLLGRVEDDAQIVLETVPAGNTRTDSAHNRYNIAPQELIHIQRQARQRGLDIVGFYHSHPDHPAQWSATDLAEAHWFGCSYVITSVIGNSSAGKSSAGAMKDTARCRASETNAFLLTGTGEEDKRLEAQPIEVAAAVNA